MIRLEDSSLEIRRKCCACKRTMVGRRQNYQYTESGLSSVVLTNVLVFNCSCGEIVAELPALEALHSLIAFDLFRKGTLLSGEEVRFMRKWVGYSATHFAGVMGVAKETVSRWENQKTTISKECDRLLRLVCFAKKIETTLGTVVAKNLSNNLIEAAKLIRSLNMVDILQSVEARFEGSRPIRIDPQSLITPEAFEPSGTVVQ